MKQEDIPPNLLSDFDKDFKAEVVAAELVEHGIDADRILILMLGAIKRTFSKDVDSIQEEISEYDHKEYHLINTLKEGIYDMLPQGLFHKPSTHKAGTTEKDIIKSIKQRKEEERQARKFFVPFEATINFLRMHMALYENRLDKKSHYDELINIFSNQWEIFQYLNPRQSNIFLHLIPIIHAIRDDHPVIETIMEMMFLYPTKVSMRRQVPLNPVNPILSHMGESELGVNLTTGNQLYDEGVDEILIKIGPMGNKAFREFMPGGINHRILQFLVDFLLPVQLDIVTEFVMDDKDKIARLKDVGNDLNTSLGADTYL